MLPGIRIVVVTGSFIRALGGDGECVILASKRFAEMLADEVDPAPPSPSAAQPSQDVAGHDCPNAGAVDLLDFTQCSECESLAGLSKEGSETP